MPKRTPEELSRDLRIRAQCLCGQAWEAPATREMMVEAADMLSQLLPQLRAQIEALIAKWRLFATQYEDDGDLATPTLEICANELSDLLAHLGVADAASKERNSPEIFLSPEQAKAICLDCGLPYADFPLDVVLPRSQWLEIHPAEHGLLCASCIVKRAATVPRCTVVHLILEIAPPPSGGTA